MTSPTPQNDNTNNPSENTEREKATLNRFLQEVGIGETDFDPSSLIALKDILHGKVPPGFSDPSKRGKRTRETSGPLESINSNGTDFAVKDGIGGNGKKPSAAKPSSIPRAFNQLRSNDNEGVLSFYVPPDATETERLILNELRTQGAMLRNIQHRLSALENPTTTTTTQAVPPPRFVPPPARIFNGPPRPPQIPRDILVQQLQQPQQPVPAVPNAAAFPGVETYRRIAHLLHGIRTLHRNDLNNRRPGLINAWVLIRVVIFASVIISRNTSSKSSPMMDVLVPLIVVVGTLLYFYERSLRTTYICLRRYGYRVLIQGERVDFTAAENEDDNAAAANEARNNNNK